MDFQLFKLLKATFKDLPERSSGIYTRDLFSAIKGGNAKWSKLDFLILLQTTGTGTSLLILVPSGNIVHVTMILTSSCTRRLQFEPHVCNK